MSEWLEYFIAAYMSANLLFLIWRIKIENQLEGVEHDRKVLRRNYDIAVEGERQYKLLAMKEIERNTELNKKIKELNKGGENE